MLTLMLPAIPKEINDPSFRSKLTEPWAVNVDGILTISIFPMLMAALSMNHSWEQESIGLDFIHLPHQI